MTPRIDANMLVGRFPFRAVARAGLEDCLARMEKLGFTRAVVSPMDAIFQEDSYAAEATLAEAVAGRSEFIHFKIVNPARPWWKRDLDRALDELNVKGIRLVRTYHEYNLTGPEVEPVFGYAAERDLPVLVMCKMQDFRMQWLLRTSEAETPEVQPMLEKFTDNRLILAGLHFRDMLDLADTIDSRDNVLLDTSRLKGPWKTFEKLSEKLDLTHVAFGSLWPINLPECPLEQIRNASISDEVKAQILGGNLARLLLIDGF